MKDRWEVRKVLQGLLDTATMGCVIQHTGWTCGTCFFNIFATLETEFGTEVGPRAQQSYWEATLLLRGDYTNKSKEKKSPSYIEMSTDEMEAAIKKFLPIVRKVARVSRVVGNRQKKERESSSRKEASVTDRTKKAMDFAISTAMKAQFNVDPFSSTTPKKKAKKKAKKKSKKKARRRTLSPTAERVRRSVRALRREERMNE